MKIGNTDINGQIILAPMAGFTDSPYRLIARKAGSAFVVSELVSAEGVVRKNTNTADLLRFTEQERPVGIQLFGNKSDVMASAAGIIEELQPDFIDINAGCSVRRILNGGSGAGLLLNPELLGDIAYSMVKKIRIPVSAKIRIGIDEDNKNYREVLKILFESGVSFVTVHGRTRAQAFKGNADWEIIREIKNFSKIPVIGNGDIKTHQEALERLDYSGCDGVMIGRAAVGNPWIFSGISPIPEDVFGQIKDHLDSMLDFYGPRGLILFRKHAVKYIKGMRNSAQLRAELVNAETKTEFLKTLRTYFNK